MKRVLCLVVSMLMMFSVTAFADEYDILSKPITSCEADVLVTFTVNEPMTVLNLIASSIQIDNFVNLQALAESIANSKSTGKIKLNLSEDYMKAKMSYEIFEIAPITVNRNFKLTTEMKLGMWLEWDFSDELNPVLRYIIQQPLCDKYTSIDLVEMMTNQGISVPDLVSGIKNFLNRERIDELSGKLTDMLRQNSSLSSKGNKITITLTNAQLQNFIAQYMEFIVAEFDDNEEYDLLDDGDFGYISETLPSYDEINDFFKEFPLFDETALVMEYTKNPSGSIKTASSSFNMNINLEKILDEMGIYSPDASKNLKFSIKSDVSYKSVNSKSIKVDFPTLTENDIMNFNVFLGNMNYEYEWNGDNCYHDEYGHVYNEYLPSAKDTFYVSLSNITESHRSYGYDYVIERNADLITLTDAKGKECFKKAQLTVNSNEIDVDGVKYTLPNPVIVKDAVIYMDSNAIKYIFNLDLEYASVDLETNELTCSFNRRSPQCHHTDEEINGWEAEYGDTDECEHYQYIYVWSDYPYDGVGYIKIRDIINEIASACGVNYENGVLTLTDPTGESGFGTVVITVGSNEYIVDKMTITSGKPAIEYNDSVYIDESAAFPIFGFETHNPSLEYTRNYNEDGSIQSSYMSYNARLVRKSPLCPHTDEELKDYHKWWE